MKRLIRYITEPLYLLRFLLIPELIDYNDDNTRKCSKVIIISSVCAGKSTFSKKKDFSGYRLIDSKGHTNNPIVAGTYSNLGLDAEDKFHIKYLNEASRNELVYNYPDNLCVIEVYLKDQWVLYNCCKYEGIYCLAVLPTKINAIKYYFKRWYISCNRNIIKTLLTTSGFSIKWIDASRREVISFTRKHNLVTFKSFEEALE